MVYETNCNGTSELDQSNTTEDESGYIMMGFKTAYAQKFTPTSKCLSSVTIKLKNLADADATVWITKDVNGFPEPNFVTTNLGSFERTYTEIPSLSYTEINFPLDIELPDLNPLWIVITSNYDPTSIDNVNIMNIAGKNGDSINKFALKIGNDNWIYEIRTPVFKTFKKTFGTVTPKYGCSDIVHECVRDDEFGTFEDVDKCNETCKTPPPKKYKCIAGVCTEDPTGTFDESTCGGTCTQKPENNNMITYAIIGLGALYLLTRKKQ